MQLNMQNWIMHAYCQNTNNNQIEWNLQAPIK